MVIHGTIRGNSCLLFNTNDHKLTVNVREYYSFEPQSQTLRFLRLGVRIKYLREGIKTLCVRLRYRCHPAVDLSHAENAENAENACCTRVGHPDGSKGEATCLREICEICVQINC